jgi:hypothetical protein
MIEAMNYKNLVVHPDLGALPETAGLGQTLMYHWQSDQKKHFDAAYSTIFTLLEIAKNDRDFLNRCVQYDENHLDMMRIDTFRRKWTTLLEQVHGNR